MSGLEQQLKSLLKGKKKEAKRKSRAEKVGKDKKKTGSKAEDPKNRKSRHDPESAKQGEKTDSRVRQTEQPGKKVYTPKSYKNIPSKVRSMATIDEFRKRTESYTQEVTAEGQTGLSPRTSFQKNGKKSALLRTQIKSLKFDKNYKGIYQVLLSELSDFPENILTTENEPDKFAKNRDSNVSQRESTVALKKFSNCSFHCGPEDPIATFESGGRGG